MSNQPPTQPTNIIDTNSMNELAMKMENNLAHATQIINDTLAHSRQLMTQIHHAHQQNQAHYASASSQLSQGQPYEQPTSAQPEESPAIDPVTQAVQNLAQQEQGALQHMQQQAQQHFQQAGQNLQGSAPHQPGEQDQQHQGTHGFAESIASTLHHGVEQGESMIQHMKLEAQKHMHDAEKSIQQSLSSIHHAIEGQGKMFAQQTPQTPSEQNKPAQPPHSAPSE